MRGGPRILCVAGEASGDLLLAPVIAALRRDHEAVCVGTGGDLSLAAGLELLAHVREFAAHGLVEAAPVLPVLLRVWRLLRAELPRVDALLLVDAPELNIRLLPLARRLGKPVVWLAPPQSWAWRPARLRTVALASTVACLFPFEAAFHQSHGVPAVCVGHPLAERGAWPANGPNRLVMLPGSRSGTIRRLLEPMLAAGSRLVRDGTVDGLDLGLAPTVDLNLLAPSLAVAAVPVAVHRTSHAALTAGGLVVAGVGTVTLESALAGRPTLALARLHPLSAAVAKRLVCVPHLALPNLVLGRRAHPELWQGEVSAAAIVREIEALRAPSVRARAVADAERLHELLDLGPPTFGVRVAGLVAACLDRPGGAPGPVVSVALPGLSSGLFGQSVCRPVHQPVPRPFRPPPRPSETSVTASQKPLIVVPTYNECENLPPLLDRIFEVVPDIDVLVVDDNSPDGTGGLADARAAGNPRIHVLHRAGKEGLGKAYLAGFKWALERDYTHIFEMDADFSHDPATLPRFLEAAKTADLVLGSRWVEGGGTVGWPLQRQLLSKGGSLYARTVLGVDIRDLTGGFKCFHRRVLTAIDLDSVQTRGYGFQIELTFRALRHGFKVVEIPIRFADRVAGQSKMSFRIMSEALTMVWKLRLAA